MKTPADVVNYIENNNMLMDFMSALTSHVGGYSIGEIVDREFVKTDAGFNLKSKSYSIDVPIVDDDVLTALHNGLYVSAFISRNQDSYQAHFLCHQYPVTMKSQFDEQILNEVLRYMTIKTVIALRLDSEEKIKDYIAKKL